MKLYNLIPPRILILPDAYREIPAPGPDSRAYGRRDGMFVIVTIDVLDDGSEWLHASCSFRNHLPNWSDLNDVKDIFIGRDRKAIVVMPPEKEKVNYMPYCMHLYSKQGEEFIPDFRAEGGLI